MRILLAIIVLWFIAALNIDYNGNISLLKEYSPNKQYGQRIMGVSAEETPTTDIQDSDATCTMNKSNGKNNYGTSCASDPNKVILGKVVNTKDKIRLKYELTNTLYSNEMVKVMATHKENKFAEKSPKNNEKDDKKDKKTILDVETKSEPTYEWVELPKWIVDKYNAKPIIISDNLLYLNASKEFYLSTNHLKSPELILWVISKGIYQTAYSNSRLFEFALSQNIAVHLMDEDGFDLLIQNNTISMLYNSKVVEMPDFVIPRIGSRINHYGMAVIMQLNKMGVPILNDFAAHYVSRDKYYQLQNLAEHSVPIPKSLIIGNRELSVDEVAEMLTEHFKGFPIILKRLQGLQGKGIVLLRNMHEFREVFELMDHSTPYLFQEYISESEGRDIRIIVIGGRAIGSMMRVAKTGFKSNFHQGGFVRPVKLSPQMEWLAIEAANKLGMDIAGVDVLIDKNTFRICEVNSSPGYEGFEMATGVNVPEQLIDYVKVRLTKWFRSEHDL